MPKLLEGHSRPIAQNFISTAIFELLYRGVPAVVTWYIAHQFSIRGWAWPWVILFAALAFCAMSIGFYFLRRQGVATGGIKIRGTGTVKDADPAIGNLESKVRRLEARDETWSIQVAARDGEIATLREQLKGVEKQLGVYRVEPVQLLPPESQLAVLKKADIRGEIREGSFTSQSTHARVRVRIIFYNRGELTTLRGFKLKVSHPYYQQTWQSRSVRAGVIGDDMPNLVELLHQKPPFELVPGKHIDGWLQFEMHNVERSDELFDPSLVVTDGFGDEHEIESKLRLRRTR